ncbi:MAG: hypothetical protein FJX35_25985 [Alphaproteobacteria bacterium]|nr:hypothetical protein [Alphaproteobacteria bacterium]
MAALRQFIFSLPLLAAAAADAAVCDYDIGLAGTEPITLDIAVACQAGADGLEASRAAASLLRSLAVDGRPMPLEQASWPIGSALFTARYRLALGGDGAAQSGVAAVGRSVMAELETWLLRPASDDTLVRLRPRLPADFVAALPFKQADGAYVIPASLVPRAGYTAFGRLVETTLALPGPGFSAWNPGTTPARLRIVRLDGTLDLEDARLFRWVERSALAVARYWRGFPVADALLIVVPMTGRSGVVFGRVVPAGGISIMLQLGEHAGAGALDQDWVLVHELTHTASPFMARGFWLMEGLATLIEPIVRARAGWLTPEAVWAEFAQGMPRGLDAMTRTGLQGSGRAGIYWGGALLLLLADVDIRRSSEGRRGLENCLLDVLRQGGDATERWTPEAFMAACDRAIGRPVLAGLAERHRFGGSPVELDALWRRLGVVREGGEVRLVDAPEAWLRDAILWGGTAGPPPALPPRID